MPEGIHIPLKISVFDVVMSVVLSAIVYPIFHRIGEKLTEKFFSWKDSTTQ